MPAGIGTVGAGVLVGVGENVGVGANVKVGIGVSDPVLIDPDVLVAAIGTSVAGAGVHVARGVILIVAVARAGVHVARGVILIVAVARAGASVANTGVSEEEIAISVDGVGVGFGSSSVARGTINCMTAAKTPTIAVMLPNVCSVSLWRFPSLLAANKTIPTINRPMMTAIPIESLSPFVFQL